jgi:exonuclease SbcD
MLRILHTADWHLGQTFHGYDRDAEHACFLEWLLQTLTERRPDALIVSGDVFDTVNPSAAAQKRFFDFLARAHAALPALQMVIIAGNHDAAARLEAPSDLLESLRITVIGTVARNGAGEPEPGKFLVPLRNTAGETKAIAVAVPFLRPSDVPVIAGASDPYLDGIRELYRRATDAALALRDSQYPGAALIALGHCHMQDGAESRDSERRIVIGGAEALRTDTFPPELSYVALGHLHKPQELDGGRICYSGSPIPLSFSEKEYRHRVLEVEMNSPGLPAVTPLFIPQHTALLRLPNQPALMEDVLQAIAIHPFNAALLAEQWPFLEIRVLDDKPDPARRRRIEEALSGKPVRLVRIHLETPARPSGATGELPALSLADLTSLDPEEIMAGAHREKYGDEPEPALLAALREILTAPGGDDR